MPFAHIEANAGNCRAYSRFPTHAIDDGLSRSVVCAGGIAQRLQDVLFSLSRVVGSQVDARQGIEGGGSLVGIAQLLVDADATRGILCGCREVGQPHTDNGQQIEAVALGGIVMTVEGSARSAYWRASPYSWVSLNHSPANTTPPCAESLWVCWWQTVFFRR